MKICVAGIGGIGGTLGGVLAKKYNDVSFIARGSRKEKLSKDGLMVNSKLWGNFVAKPKIVTDDVKKIETPDLLFICVKSYSLEMMCKEVEPLIGENTLVIPVMNGVDSAERTRAYLPNANVVDAVIYITTSSLKDYSISQVGNTYKLEIGRKNEDEILYAKIEEVIKVLAAAGLEAKHSKDIEATCWKKFIMNCGFNVITARYLINTGAIQESEKIRGELKALLEEALAVALAKGINLEKDLAQIYYKRIVKDISADSSSSMKLDFENKRKSEIELFGGYIVREAKKIGVKVPVTEEFYEAMKKMV
jgi:2-dehydropantoate 2-reductase